MILAYHAIFATRGFWLPNDPRGSWSTFVASWELFRFGPATKTEERCSLAHRSHDRELRLAAKKALKYPPVRFTGPQALAVAKGFAQAIQESKYVLYACAILPDHVHMILQRHERPVERIIGHLKSRATQQLELQGIHPLAEYRVPDGRVPSPWVEGRWKVFLEEDADVHRAINYVRRNPIKEGKREQKWSFVRHLPADHRIL